MAGGYCQKNGRLLTSFPQEPLERDQETIRPVYDSKKLEEDTRATLRKWERERLASSVMSHE
jgi:hypothetical protein